jgi:hypothetical protein
MHRHGEGATGMSLPIDRPWAYTSQPVLDRLGIAAAQGLNSTAVRRPQYSSNGLQEARIKSAWRILVEQ